ncbi:MAG: hypothetical protein ACOC8O_00380 [Natronomonas sp.]
MTVEAQARRSGSDHGCQILDADVVPNLVIDAPLHEDLDDGSIGATFGRG